MRGKGFPAFLKRNEASIQVWTDSLSHVAQIVALLVAGFWTYRVFYLSEAPSLEPQGDTAVELFWQPAAAHDSCLGKLRIDFNNRGKRSMEVQRVRIQGWFTDAPASAAEPHQVSLDTLERGGRKFVDRYVPESDLIGPYPPGAGRHDMLIWQFQRQATSKVVLLLATVKSAQSPRWERAYAWDYLCRSAS